MVLLLITLIFFWALCHDSETLTLYSTKGVFCMRLVFTWTLGILNNLRCECVHSCTIYFLPIMFKQFEVTFGRRLN